MRPLDWLLTILALATIGIVLWPAASLPLAVLIVAAALAVAGMSRDARPPRAAAVLLGGVVLTLLAEPELRASTGGYDPRLAWTAVLSALIAWQQGIRAHTLTAAAVMVTSLAPPADISLLRVAPPVLVQVLICSVLTALQAFERAKPWWTAFRIGEPLLALGIVVGMTAPFARNGLTFASLLRWHFPVVATAIAVALVLSVLRFRRGAGSRTTG